MTHNTPMYRPITEQVDLAVGLTVTTPPPLAQALDTLHANGGGALLYPWMLPTPVMLIGLGDDQLCGSGNIPVIVGGALAVTNYGPVVRLALTIIDNPTNPFLAECYINVADEWELDALQKIVRQQTLKVVACQGHTIQRIISVSVKPGAPPTLRDLLAQATAALVRLTPGQLDWDRARAEAERLLPT